MGELIIRFKDFSNAINYYLAICKILNCRGEIILEEPTKAEVFIGAKGNKVLLFLEKPKFKIKCKALIIFDSRIKKDDINVFDEDFIRRAIIAIGVNLNKEFLNKIINHIMKNKVRFFVNAALYYSLSGEIKDDLKFETNKLKINNYFRRLNLIGKKSAKIISIFDSLLDDEDKIKLIDKINFN